MSADQTPRAAPQPEIDGEVIVDNYLISHPRRRDVNAYICSACKTLHEMGMEQFEETDAIRQFVAQKLHGFRVMTDEFTDLVRDDTLDVNGALVNSRTVSLQSISDGGYMQAAPYSFLRELLDMSHIFPVYLLTTGVEMCGGEDSDAFSGARDVWEGMTYPEQARSLYASAIATLRVAFPHDSMEAIVRVAPPPFRALHEALRAGRDITGLFRPEDYPKVVSSLRAMVTSASPIHGFPYANMGCPLAIPPAAVVLERIFSERPTTRPSNSTIEVLQGLTQSFLDPNTRVKPILSDEDLERHQFRQRFWTPFRSVVDAIVSHSARSVHLFGFGWWCIMNASTLVHAAEHAAEHAHETRAVVLLEIADHLLTCVSCVCILSVMRFIGYSDPEVNIRDAIDAANEHDVFTEYAGLLRSFECGAYMEFMVGPDETQEEWSNRLRIARVLRPPDASTVSDAMMGAIQKSYEVMETFEAAFPVEQDVSEEHQMRFTMRELVRRGPRKRVARAPRTMSAEYLIPARFAARETGEQQIGSEDAGESASHAGGTLGWGSALALALVGAAVAAAATFYIKRNASTPEWFAEDVSDRK